MPYIFILISVLIFFGLKEVYQRRAEISKSIKNPFKFKLTNPQKLLLGSLSIIILFSSIFVINFYNVSNNDSDKKHNVNYNTQLSPEAKFKDEISSLIRYHGYWLKYQKILQEDNIPNGNWEGYRYNEVEFNSGSVKILNKTNNSCIVEYTATHSGVFHVPSSSNLYIYDVYEYTEKAVKKNGIWVLKGPIYDPIKDVSESYSISEERYYSIHKK